MKYKSGTTLIEAVISVFVVAVAIVTLLQALGSGVFGTLDVNRKTSALNLAKSQLENISAQAYNASTGNLSNIYGLVTANGSDITDTTNYNISGTVEYVNGSTSLQKITVNVTYMNGKVVQLIGYKEEEGNINISSPYRGMLVTDNIQDVPILYSGSGGTAIDCAEVFPGYYQIFNTSGSLYGSGEVSITWKFHWTRWDNTLSSMGAPMVAIYEGIPSWANRSYLGVVQTDGVVYREQGGWTLGTIGDLPGDGGYSVCECYCDEDCSDEEDPVWWTPHDCLGLYNDYPCSGACITGDEYWTYDYALVWPTSYNEGYSDRTFTTTLSQAGTYTILFFNAENKIDIDTITASIAYMK